MAEVAARSGNKVRLYARNKAMVDSINTSRRNSCYLTDFTLHENIIAYNNVAEALEGSTVVILALPTQTIPEWLVQHKELIPESLLLCNTAKGLYLKEHCLLSQIIPKCLGRDQPYAILSGPSFAKEMVLNHPTAGNVQSQHAID